jgi:hypothetical protein
MSENTHFEAIAGDHSEARAAAPTGLKQIQINFVPNSISSFATGT